MRTKIATAALIGGIGLTGGLLIGPGFASAADSTTTTTVSGRLAAIKEALKGLVADKTLTQAQADKVATTLDTALPHRGDGPRGGRHAGGALRPDVVAKVLGITETELHTQLRAGKTLAQIAAAKGISKATLIDDLVQAAEERLAQAVTDGKLSQAQADVLKGTLKARVTEKVDRVGRGPGRDHGGPPPAGDADDNRSVTPSSTTSSTT